MFLEIISNEVKEYGSEVLFYDEEEIGLTKWFIVSVWADAFLRAAGDSWIKESWYNPPEQVATSGLWRLKCGNGYIAIAKNQKVLGDHENFHNTLRTKYAKHPLAINIAGKYRRLNDMALEINLRLREFSDMQHLPGHCNLC